MTTRRLSRHRSQQVIAAVSSLLALSLTANAQEKPADATAPDTLQEVVVTGSRIARPDLERLQPTTTVNSKTFDERGYTDVGQALSELPAFGVQPVSANNQQSTTSIAQSFVDLYALGSQRTLTLVNGRRFVSSNSASFGNGAQPGEQVDLNVIPTKLIDRVETVSVGGAPIYGSDAIAGTVNIILKKDYQGLDVDAQTGVSDDKDAWNYRARILAGTNFFDGRGNVTGVAELSKSDGLAGNSRTSVSSNPGFLPPAVPGKFDNVFVPNETIGIVNTSGLPAVDDQYFAPVQGFSPQTYGITSPAGQLLGFQPGSSALQPYNYGTATGNPVFAGGGDGASLGQFNNLLSGLEKINIDGLGNFKINDHLNVFAEGWFSETHGENVIAQPDYHTSFFGPANGIDGDFKLPVNDPFLSIADQNTIRNALLRYASSATVAANGFVDPNWDPNHFYLARASNDLFSGSATANQVLGRGVLGLNGDFEVINRNFNWEVAANYGYSRNISEQPNVVFQNEANALNVTTNAAGQIVCAGNPVAAPVSTASSTCAPLNPFGSGSPSPQAIAYITHLATAESANTQRDVTANLSGDIIHLPGGEAKLAVGFENRREAAKFSPDTFYTGGFGDGVSLTAIEGAYHTNEFYAEGLVPILGPAMDIPGLRSLELEGAVRRVNNSIAGDSTTYTEGLRFSPVEDIQFRANKTKSIRAPAITELFLPTATSFSFAADPCDHTVVGQGPSPAVRAKNCAAAGIDTSTFSSNVLNGSVKGESGGNTNLQSEQADSKTYGVVLRPRWVPRFNVSVDYVDIKLDNAIQQLTLTQVLDACYDSTDFPNNPSCKQFQRAANGQITDFQVGFVNAGLLHFQGIQAGLDYTAILPADLGSLETRVNYLDTKTLVLKVGSAATQNLAGDLLNGNPKGKGTMDLDYRKGPFSWYWQAQYIHSMNFNNQNTPTSQDILGVSRWWLINSTISFDFSKNFTMRLVVDNVFDKEPPFPALAGVQGNFAAPTSLYFSGILGRTYLLNANYHF
jgi:iron complex outermembrane receptor protein